MEGGGGLKPLPEILVEGGGEVLSSTIWGHKEKDKKGLQDGLKESLNQHFMGVSFDFVGSPNSGGSGIYEQRSRNRAPPHAGVFDTLPIKHITSMLLIKSKIFSLIEGCSICEEIPARMNVKY